MTCHDQPRRMIYGRRQAPKLKPSHKQLLQTLLPQIAVRLPEEVRPGPLAVLGLPADRPLWLEIGFGGGEHLVAMASAHPEVTVVGVEPYVTGVAKLLSEIEARALTNVRVLMDDARLLLRCLPDGALARGFILYPDPWPKARHHKRRIVNDASVAELARLMMHGGELRLATDHADYRRWMLAVMRRRPEFEWTALAKADWEIRPTDQPATRYEEKARRAGRQPVYLSYRRR